MRLQGRIRQSFYTEGWDIFESDPYAFYQHGGGGKGGGGGGYSPPPAPDPAATAAAQGAQDRKTAQTNALLLNPNISSPYGSVGYDVNNYTIDGENISRPTQTTKLSDAQQAELTARNEVSKYLGQSGVALAQKLPQSELVGPATPARPTSIDYSHVDKVGSMADYDSDRKAVSQSIYDEGYGLMKPELEQQRSRLENRLAQTGNPLGSEGYMSEMDRYDRGANSARANLANSAIGKGYDVQSGLFNAANITRQGQLSEAMLPYNTDSQLRNDQIGEAQLLRNQQINELSAIQQGREAITLPVGGQYNQNALRAPDIAGMTQANYQNQLNSYNQQYQSQQAQGNAATSGLFGIASAVGGPLMSSLFG